MLFQASCRGETNECRNGGTPIWDPVKPYACLCRDGYEGEFCEKGKIYLCCIYRHLVFLIQPS